MENKDKEYMRFLASCFIMVGGASAKIAVQQADALLKELGIEDEEVAGGIVDIVPKRKRTRST